MRYALAFALGLFTGLAIYRPAGAALNRYADHSLPKPDYVGPRYKIGNDYVSQKEWSCR